MSVLITGGTGFVGTHLLKAIPGSTITTRNGEKAEKRFGDQIAKAITWDPSKEALKLDPDENFSAVVNLMGESVAEGRWNKQKKQRMHQSRVAGTRKLVEAILSQKKKPKVFVSASAVGYYGSRGESLVTEDDGPGDVYLSELCKAWEDATSGLTAAGVRVVIIRIGIVLGRNGGALGKLIPLFKYRLGGPLGNGKQWVPWIHVQDLVSLILWAIESPGINGVLNGTAPNPVTNREMTRNLAKALNVSAFLHAPKWGVRLALGEFAESLFYSQRVIPAAAVDQGFVFKYSRIQDAFREIITDE